MLFEHEAIYTGLKTGKKANGDSWYLLGFKNDNIYWSVFTTPKVYETLKDYEKNSTIIARYQLNYDYKTKKYQLYVTEVI